MSSTGLFLCCVRLPKPKKQNSLTNPSFLISQIKLHIQDFSHQILKYLGKSIWILQKNSSLRRPQLGSWASWPLRSIFKKNLWFQPLYLCGKDCGFPKLHFFGFQSTVSRVTLKRFASQHYTSWKVSFMRL